MSYDEDEVGFKVDADEGDEEPIDMPEEIPLDTDPELEDPEDRYS